MSVFLLTSSTLFAQPETGSQTHTVGGRTIERSGVPAIEVFGERGRETSRETIGADRLSGGRERGANSRPSTVISLTVVINDEEFDVTHDAQIRFTEFINTYHSNGKVGGYIAAIASVFSLFGLLSLESAAPRYDAVLKLGTFDNRTLEEIVTTLSAPDLWNRIWRDKAKTFIEGEMIMAQNQKRYKDYKMWLRLRDIIAHPQRYRHGGMKFNSLENKLMFRSYPREVYRSIAGFDIQLTGSDIEHLKHLTNYLMHFPQSRDFILYADYIYDLDKPASEFGKINARDKMILNYSLLVLPPEIKMSLGNAFSINMVDRGKSYFLWKSLRSFLEKESWSNGMAMDSIDDDLGFDMNEPFISSDLVTGEYPGNSLPSNWHLMKGQQTYQFYYPGG